MTPTPAQTGQDLQDALVVWLQTVLAGKEYKGADGTRQQIEIYKNDLPIPTANDDDDGPETTAVPYGIVRLNDGRVETWEGPQMETVVLIFCVWDDDPNRTGYRDILSIKEKVLTAMRKQPHIGAAFEVVPPIEWAASDEDTHPFYFGAMSLNAKCPVAHKEASDYA